MAVMSDVSDIADKIGRKRIAATVGVGVTAVSNAVARGVFPATWADAIRALAKTQGLECPGAVFGMKLAPHRGPGLSNSDASKGEDVAAGGGLA